MKALWDKWGGGILTCLGALVLVGVIIGIFSLLTKLITPDKSSSLALLAIGGVLVLIFMLTAVAMVFSALGLANRELAMGLPEGSIRAVIALSLIVLFAILSVFLYQGISATSGSPNLVQSISEAERAQFIRDHSSARDLQAVFSKAPDGTQLKDKDGNNLYDVSYRSTNLAADDFAKQLLVLLGTLMTAITSFYLGAGTATNAVAAGQAGASPAPTVSGVNPTTGAIGGPLHLEVLGKNLNTVTHVKIVNGNAQIVGTNVKSSPTSVVCDLDLKAATAGAWDVVVDDGGALHASKSAALTLA
jgi:hypothetical protein